MVQGLAPHEEGLMRESIPLEGMHPLFQGGDLFRMNVEADRIVSLEVELGTHYRGIEKLAEAKSWDQLPFLLERICGMCSSSHPAAAVRAMEELGGVSVPERAQYIRTLACELERVQSHLLWFGTVGHIAGFQSLWMWTWKYRERICKVFETVFGNRLIPSVFVAGGVRRDVDEETVPWIQESLDRFEPVLDLLEGVLAGNLIFRVRTKNIGVLSEEGVRRFGMVGPAARASGVALDVRKDDPYFAYPWVEWNLALRQEGDVHANAEIRLFEMRESIDIVRQCLRQMKSGPIHAPVKNLPAGMGIGRVEAPRGELFYCMAGDGTHRPVRVQIRAPSSANLPALEETAIGADLDDAAVILAAADPCTGCAERMVVVETTDPAREIPVGAELVRRSRDKTGRLREKENGTRIRRPGSVERIR
jgi:Ni,Fe-hydrogenase III large subunit